MANLSRTGLEVVREIAPEAEDWEIQRELGLLDLAERSLELPFSSLSNGERTKVLLAAMFLKENAFLLIESPPTIWTWREAEGWGAIWPEAGISAGIP